VPINWLSSKYYYTNEKYLISNLFTMHIYIYRLLKYEKEKYARIGVMPRYGDAESTRWFEVEPNCTFHILNCFEEGDDVSNYMNIIFWLNLIK